ncbi:MULTISPECIES: LysR substrate-binding domain-containing protein [Mesorhizobium]|uniref:LysR substrate-binding domain-containing protein n=2 Tax=Mesorhizobium TaxID=68287 RepID=A0ABU5APB4_9HYPH|nr:MULTISPECIES: LysR substrate-binding domain-containing protein [Mesorhizobium]MDX8539123.1 LysR substrate-binding domain-containing protein [Mesorhizobium abyssinicae]RWF61210.1 MAG: LysR family transcriptional regulator [Mesorhizobium sp.]TGQ40440.1 LysR family transcriptional regulator [Mesorhizobium sp. M4B.F.Ca.ET.214.01.1.1]TGQ60497.1 LysR family transcriptional regulator [Mesorhizobium sp. M4B.F.Ca.ET.211.01.1.1]TGU36365.1 LysR family transcriptional regulator [Mesorhizobium sp. M4B.F
MRRVTFDLDVLRTFVTGMELGSFAKAAERLGRSTSAVSAQLKKLEEQAATPIFRKSGRGLALTEAGETMLGYARRLLELNDEAAAAIHDVELEGWVRLGLQEDFGEAVLPEVLGRFARAHPKVRIEARIARSHELADRITQGSLDIALAWHNGASLPYSRQVADVQMRWIGPAKPIELGAPGGEPLPLVALEAPCLLRTVATETLDRAGLSWRMAFSSPSLGGIWAAVGAGLGLTIRTDIGLPANVRAMASGTLGLPALPKMALVLHQKDAELDPVAARLAEILLQAAVEALPESAETKENLPKVA